MWLDKQLMFSEDQTLAQTAKATDSTNIIDLGEAKKGEGEPIEVLAQITDLLVGASSTLQIKLITDSAVGFGAAPVTLFDSGALAVGTFVTGYQASIRVLPNDCKRFLKMTYTTAVATTTGGTISSGLVKTLQSNK